MMQKLGLWVALCVGLSMSGGGALAQANSQAQATLEQLLGHTYRCGSNWWQQYVYRPGEGHSGWFVQGVSRSGNVRWTRDMQIRGGSGYEVRAREYQVTDSGVQNRGSSVRFRVMENGSSIKFFDHWDQVRQRITTLNCDRY